MTNLECGSALVKGSANWVSVEILIGMMCPSCCHWRTAKCRVEMCRVADHLGSDGEAAHLSADELSMKSGVGCKTA